MENVGGLAPAVALDVGTQGVLLLVAPGVRAAPADLLDVPPGAPVHGLGSSLPRREAHRAVVLVVHDIVDLRVAATGLGHVGTASTVAVVFEREVTALPSVVWRPGWPMLERAVAVRRPRAHVQLDFADPAPVRSVIAHLALASTPAVASSSAWPVLGMRRDEPRLWPPNDAAAVVAGPKRLFEAAGDLPPDVVLAGAYPEQAWPRPDHPVLGRPPVLVRSEPDLTWAEISTYDEPEASALLTARGPSSLGPVDDQLFNPVGFDRTPTGPAVPLRARADGALVVDEGAGTGMVVADATGRVSECDLPRVRRLPGLALDWTGGNGPQAYARTVARLAAAGVPLVTEQAPGWAPALLASSLVDVLTETPDLADSLSREERSIRTRREALRHHGASPWRSELAASVGAQRSPATSVTVLLVTRRPEMVRFALRQVARQRGVTVELVLAPHGFRVDPQALDEFRSRCAAALTLVEVDADVPFGDALNQAAERATGDVLVKMDDDDWYGPDFLGDLLLARAYSGADLVGCLPEITFLEPIRTTTRRHGATEVFDTFVAGGTMMVDPGVLRALGGFRSTRKYVDAALLRALTASGASIYRTHGLGYVLRRRAAGHTWDPGLDYFLHPDRAAVRWQGFRPSDLLEPQPEDLPPPGG